MNILNITGRAVRPALRLVVRRVALATAIAALATSAATVPALAEGFGDRPITLLVGFPAGGSNDMAARIIAPHLGRELGTTVVVEIKAGASGTIAAMATVKAPPDGHTLFASSMSAIVVAPQAFKNPPFDPRKDLKAINLVGLTPQVVSVGPTLPQVKSLTELIALSKTRSLTMASSGIGGLPHLAIELLIDGVQESYPAATREQVREILGVDRSVSDYSDSERMELDMALYGECFGRVRSDGTVERIDPTTVVR